MHVPYFILTFFQSKRFDVLQKETRVLSDTKSPMFAHILQKHFKYSLYFCLSKILLCLKEPIYLAERKKKVQLGRFN